MNNKSTARKTLVFLFKLALHVITLLIFVKGFSFHYLGLRFLSRTLAVTLGAFVVFTAWLTSVYGKIEIGQKKSSPLFQTFALNLLITNALTFVALRVMTYHDNFSFSNDLVMLGIIYVVQLLVGRFLIYSTNSLYFVNYVPENTIVINFKSDQVEKVLNFLNSHKKQYKVHKVLNDVKIERINFNNIDTLYVLGDNEAFINDLIHKCMHLNINIFYEVNIPYVSLNKQEAVVVDDVLLFQYNTSSMTEVQAIVKRSLDIVFSLIGFVVAAPFMLLVALMIKLDDGGPVFFSQERLTINNKVFKILKFRSMKMNSGDIPAEKNDDRITKSGKIIRKLRLDELPQLINILKGDMSIVGPRPESVVITEKIIETVPEFTYRLKVKAGLTGTAQILGKYNTQPKDKLILDLYYIKNFSILNDFKLMFQTLIVFVKKDSTEGFENTKDKKDA